MTDKKFGESFQDRLLGAQRPLKSPNEEQQKKIDRSLLGIDAVIEDTIRTEVLRGLGSKEIDLFEDEDGSLSVWVTFPLYGQDFYKLIRIPA